jgi:hypothetical protein
MTLYGPGSREEFLRRASAYNAAFLGGLRDARRFHKVEYLRGDRQATGRVDEDGWPILGRGNPEGVFIAWETPDGHLRFGWSSRNNGVTSGTVMYDDGPAYRFWHHVEPKPFSKVEGLYRAIRRSLRQPQGYWTDGVPRRILLDYAEFANRAARDLREHDEYRRVYDAEAAAREASDR